MDRKVSSSKAKASSLAPITRSNRVLGAKLDAFAFELLTFLSMGSPLAEASQGGQRSNAPVPAVEGATGGAAVQTLRPAAA